MAILRAWAENRLMGIKQATKMDYRGALRSPLDVLLRLTTQTVLRILAAEAEAAVPVDPVEAEAALAAVQAVTAGPVAIMISMPVVQEGVRAPLEQRVQILPIPPAEAEAAQEEEAVVSLQASLEPLLLEEAAVGEFSRELVVQEAPRAGVLPVLQGVLVLLRLHLHQVRQAAVDGERQAESPLLQGAQEALAVRPSHSMDTALLGQAATRQEFTGQCHENKIFLQKTWWFNARV
jgi:hypothetical protein